MGQVCILLAWSGSCGASLCATGKSMSSARLFVSLSVHTGVSVSAVGRVCVMRGRAMCREAGLHTLGTVWVPWQESSSLVGVMSPAAGCACMLG